MRIKICGITQPQQGKAIASLGATALGFICVPATPRYVTKAQIQAVVEQLPQNIDRIGVFANSSLQEIYQTAIAVELTGIQLHGDESPKFCYHLRQSLPEVELIKALRVRSLQVLEQATDYINCVDTLLLDAYHAQQLGGTGKTLDWASLRQVQLNCPWFLSGGLTPNNILDALDQVHPNGIDLSSGVERAPGDKDLAKVEQLFKQLEHRSCPNQKYTAL